MVHSLDMMALVAFMVGLPAGHHVTHPRKCCSANLFTKACVPRFQVIFALREQKR